MGHLVLVAVAHMKMVQMQLAGREKECLVTHVNIPQRLCQGSGKTTSELSCGVR